MKQTKITKSAKGEDCSLQIFPYCSQNPEETILAHINSASKGIGKKSEDWFGVFSCSVCHDIIDKRRYTELTEEEIQKCILRGLHRTWIRWIEVGLVKVG